MLPGVEWVGLDDLETVPPEAIEDGDTFEANERLVEEDPEAPRKINSRIPVDLETIALKALEKEPARRYASVAEFGEDELFGGEPDGGGRAGLEVGHPAVDADRLPVHHRVAVDERDRVRHRRHDFRYPCRTRWISLHGPD